MERLKRQKREKCFSCDKYTMTVFSNVARIYAGLKAINLQYLVYVSLAIACRSRESTMGKMLHLGRENKYGVKHVGAVWQKRTFQRSVKVL